MIRQTHTYVTMEVSKSTYVEIAAKLREADYQHCFVDDTIILPGVGLVVGEIKEPPPKDWGSRDPVDKVNEYAPDLAIPVYTLRNGKVLGNAEILRAANKFGTNTGHGWVWARPDGLVARCGSTGLCQQCQIDEAAVKIRAEEVLVHGGPEEQHAAYEQKTHEDADSRMNLRQFAKDMQHAIETYSDGGRDRLLQQARNLSLYVRESGGV